MRYVFVINPAAGKGTYKAFEPRVHAYFAEHPAPYEIYYTKVNGDAVIYTRQLAETGEELMIFACGGEGTTFEVLNGVVGYDNVTISVVPTGSANDFLKSFDVSYKQDFLDVAQLVEGITVKMDLIKADEFYCLNGCSVGMDAVVAERMSHYKNLPGVSGPMAYKLAVVKTFFSRIGAMLRLTIDGETRPVKNCLFVVVGNGPAYGGGYYAVPDAKPYDGVLDYNIVDTVSKLKVPGFLKKYEKGRHAGVPFCELGRCESLSFSCDREVPINLDGEIFSRKSMTFSLIRQGVNYRVPAKLAEKLQIGQ